MMAKLGFKAGDRLGRRSPPPAPVPIPAELPSTKAGGNVEEDTDDTKPNISNETNETTAWIQSRAEPLRLIVKEDRGGIGLDSEKKRKFRQETDHVEKKVKVDEGEYRERMRAERAERRAEGLVVGAQKVLEKLEVDDMTAKEEGEKVKGRKERPLKEGNVLYRGLARMSRMPYSRTRKRGMVSRSWSRALILMRRLKKTRSWMSLMRYPARRNCRGW